MARSTRVIGDYSAREVGLNLAALNASNNSNAIPVNGANQIEFDVVHANTSGALTLTASFQTRRLGDTNWENMITRSIVAGVETISARSISRTVAGAENFQYTTGISADEFRISAFTAAGAAATDTVSVRIRVLHGG